MQALSPTLTKTPATPAPATPTSDIDWHKIDHWMHPDCAPETQAQMLTAAFGCKHGQSELNELIKSHIAKHGRAAVSFHGDVNRILAQHDLVLIRNPDGTVAMLKQGDMARQHEVGAALQDVLPQALTDIVKDYDGLLEFNAENFAGMLEILKSDNSALKSKIIASASLQDKVIHELNPLFDSIRKSGQTVNLAGVDLTDLELSNIDCPHANLDGANLSRAILINANLWGVSLVKAKLNGANLTSAGLGEANLTEANLTHANLCLLDLRQANLIKSILDEADLTSAVLTDATIIEASFNRTKLLACEMQRTVVRNVDLSTITLDDPTLSYLFEIRFEGEIRFSALPGDENFLKLLRDLNEKGTGFRFVAPGL